LSKGVLDPREYAYKKGVAAEYLRGIVCSEKYSAGKLFQVKKNVAPIKKSPDESSERISELLFGEEIIIYELWGMGLGTITDRWLCWLRINGSHFHRITKKYA
jgi:hypothetical protein